MPKKNKTTKTQRRAALAARIKKLDAIVDGLQKKQDALMDALRAEVEEGVAFALEEYTDAMDVDFLADELGRLARKASQRFNVVEGLEKRTTKLTADIDAAEEKLAELL